MKQKLFIEIVLPGLNEILEVSKGKNGKRAYNEMKKQYEHAINVFITKCRIRPVDEVFLEFLWVEPNKKRDKDNITVGKKFILDTFVKRGILKNDGWRHVKGFRDEFEVNRKQVGVIVFIDDLSNDGNS